MSYSISPHSKPSHHSALKQRAVPLDESVGWRSRQFCGSHLAPLIWLSHHMAQRGLGWRRARMASRTHIWHLAASRLALPPRGHSPSRRLAPFSAWWPQGFRRTKARGARSLRTRLQNPQNIVLVKANQKASPDSRRRRAQTPSLTGGAAVAL